MAARGLGPCPVSQPYLRLLLCRRRRQLHHQRQLHAQLAGQLRRRNQVAAGAVERAVVARARALARPEVRGLGGSGQQRRAAHPRRCVHCQLIGGHQVCCCPPAQRVREAGVLGSGAQVVAGPLVCAAWGKGRRVGVPARAVHAPSACAPRAHATCWLTPACAPRTAEAAGAAQVAEAHRGRQLAALAVYPGKAWGAAGGHLHRAARHNLLHDPLHALLLLLLVALGAAH